MSAQLESTMIEAREEEVRSIIRSDLRALSERDLEGAVRNDAEDKVMVTPEGVFKGKPQIRRYVKRLFDQFEQLKITERRIVIRGTTSVCEHTIGATGRDGTYGSVPAVAIYEIRDGKTQRLHMYFDRLSVADQMANGWLQKKLVGAIVAETVKGL